MNSNFFTHKCGLNECFHLFEGRCGCRIDDTSLKIDVIGAQNTRTRNMSLKPKDRDIIRRTELLLMLLEQLNYPGVV